ncbi:hypothetical protein D3C87_1687970 [compost metagenome]
MLDRAVERLAIRRIRQVQIDDGNAVAMTFLRELLTQHLQRGAALDAQVEFGLEPMAKHG